MDSGIIVALVLGVLFFGSIIWLVIHSNRRQPEKNKREMSIRAPEPPSKKNAA